MIKTIELVVSLKMPDTTAITALQTLQKLGFGRIKEVKRYFYYKFSVDGNLEDFKSKISKVDNLVNANKHTFDFEIKKDNYVKVLVKNTDDDGSGILSTLKDRLGFNNIKKVESAVMWGLLIDGNEKEAGKIAEKAAKDLLANENYQEFAIL
ncbi:MAG: phosphoribosylformylglycinamidine synthase subunit PurS [Nanoarchaeota archaeon]